MDEKTVQSRLEALYATWKAALQFTKEECGNLSPPLLLHVTEDYCQAVRRILLLGQETKGWEWDRTLQDKTKHPTWTYPHSWQFQEISSCSDFRANSDSIEALCWGYREFAFGLQQPELARTPLWRAFNEVRKWPDAGIMWGNVLRMDYQGGSIWSAPQNLRNTLLSQQVGLFGAELAILEPQVCLFFSGPYYDEFITTMLPGCEFLACCEVPWRELARLSHPALPRASFRTFHPRFLNQGNRWHYIEEIRKLAFGT